MILDRIENASMYRALGPAIAAALDYLRQTDFSQVPDGRHELDGDRLFSIVQHYRTKPLAEAIWEAHRQYIDVQYVVQGAERMGYASLRDDLPVRQPYDAQKDAVFYDAQGDFLEVRAGSFVIFTPHDIHAPGLAVTPSEASAAVCKVVVKCRAQEQAGGLFPWR
jgi:YhcH/YjgK/YiaL family protein